MQEQSLAVIMAVSYSPEIDQDLIMIQSVSSKVKSVSGDLNSVAGPHDEARLKAGECEGWLHLC